MGYEHIVADDRMALVGIAQMARGSGWWREGTRGGRGHMGLIMTDDGRERVIKFDTHGGTSRDCDAERSSNNLRVRLWTIASNDANGLSEEVRAEIRTKLGLKPDGGLPRFSAHLLERKIVAQVLTLIGGKELWNAAQTGFNEEVQATDLDDPSTFESSARSQRMGVTIGGQKYEEKMASRKNDLNVFFASAEALQNAGVKYVKLDGNHVKPDFEDGKPTKIKLVDAGPRYILRDLADQEDNDRVHRVFARAILAHFGGKIPKGVQELMTDFTGGHPLSVARILLIRDAIRIADAWGGDVPSYLSPRKLLESLKICGMTYAQLASAIDACGEKFNLSSEQRNAVLRTTLAYLASRGEGVKDGRAIMKGKGEANVAQEIAEGRFDGTRLGLWGCGALKTGDSLQVMTEVCFPQMTGMFAAHRSLEDGEFLAWCVGRFESLQPTPSLCMALLERRGAILECARTHKSFGIKELYALFLGERPEAYDGIGSRKSYLNGLATEIKGCVLREKLSGEVQEKLNENGDNLADTPKAFAVESVMGVTGLDLRDAGDIWLNGWKNAVPPPKCEISAVEYDLGKCCKQIAADGGTLRQNSTVTIGLNDSFCCNDQTEAHNYAEKVRDQMRSYLASHGEVSDKQLKAALYCCTQNVDDFKGWFMLAETGPRSFQMGKDGILRYEQKFTACGKPHVIRFEIDKAGTIRLTELHQGDDVVEELNEDKSLDGDEDGEFEFNPWKKKEKVADEPARRPVRTTETKDVAAPKAKIEDLLRGLTIETALAVIKEFDAFARANPGKNVKVFDWRGLADGKVRLGATQGEEKWIGRDRAAEAVNDLARKILLFAVKALYPDSTIPENVKDVMTNFGDLAGNGLEGKPLSSHRIGEIVDKAGGRMVELEIELKIALKADALLQEAIDTQVPDENKVTDAKVDAVLRQLAIGEVQKQLKKAAEVPGDGELKNSLFENYAFQWRTWHKELTTWSEAVKGKPGEDAFKFVRLLMDASGTPLADKMPSLLNALSAGIPGLADKDEAEATMAVYGWLCESNGRNPGKCDVPEMRSRIIRQAYDFFTKLTKSNVLWVDSNRDGILRKMVSKAVAESLGLLRDGDVEADAENALTAKVLDRLKDCPDRLENLKDAALEEVIRTCCEKSVAKWRKGKAEQANEASNLEVLEKINCPQETKTLLMYKLEADQSIALRTFGFVEMLDALASLDFSAELTAYRSSGHSPADFSRLTRTMTSRMDDYLQGGCTGAKAALRESNIPAFLVNCAFYLLFDRNEMFREVVRNVTHEELDPVSEVVGCIPIEIMEENTELKSELNSLTCRNTRKDEIYLRAKQLKDIESRISLQNSFGGEMYDFKFNCNCKYEINGVPVNQA